MINKVQSSLFTERMINYANCLTNNGSFDQDSWFLMFVCFLAYLFVSFFMNIKFVFKLFPKNAFFNCILLRFFFLGGIFFVTVCICMNCM